MTLDRVEEAAGAALDGRFPEALRLLDAVDAALAAAAVTTSDPRWARSWTTRAGVVARGRELEEAHRWLDRAIACPDPAARSAALCSKGRLLLRAGLRGPAQQLLREALALAERSGSPREIAGACLELVEWTGRVGDFNGASALLERASQLLARASGSAMECARDQARAASVAAAHAGRCGDTNAALAAAREVVRLGETHGWRALVGGGHHQLAMLHLDDRRFEDARQSAERCLTLAVGLGHPVGLAEANVLVGRCALYAGRLDDALLHWRAAHDATPLAPMPRLLVAVGQVLVGEEAEAAPAFEALWPLLVELPSAGSALAGLLACACGVGAWADAEAYCEALAARFTEAGSSVEVALLVRRAGDLASRGGRRALGVLARTRSLGLRVVQHGRDAELRSARAAVRRAADAGAPVVLGSVLLAERIGAGGQGTVYRATHGVAGADVAVKVLARGEFWARASFEAEMRIVAGLDHPHIVWLLDRGTVDDAAAVASHGSLEQGAPYQVLERATEGSLEPRCGSLPWAECRRVLLAVLDGLAYAHARGLVHLDLKPANVLLDGPAERPTPKLADFGLARPYRGAQPSDRIAGSPHYMAPEQLRGDDAAFGPWTDLYALGALAATLVQGGPPFPSADLDVLRRMHLESPPPPLTPRIEVPEGLETWVRCLLQKEPADRYASAAEAARELLRLEAPVRGSAGSSDTPPLLVELPTLLFSSDSFPPRAPGTPLVRERPPVPERFEAASAPRRSRLADASLALVAVRRPPLVGRTREQETVWRLLHRASTIGRAEVVVFEGPAGAGSSRMLEWIAERAEELGCAAVRRGGAADPAWIHQQARFGAVVWTVDAPDSEMWATISPWIGAACPLLVVAAARHGGPGPASGTYVRLPLAPLDDAAAGQLLRGLLPLAPELEGQLVNGGGGNPQLLAQSVAELARRDLLAPSPSGWQLRVGVRLALPASVAALWLGRLERLVAPAPADRASLWVGALLGARIVASEWREACRVAGLEDPDPIAARLVDAGLAISSNDGTAFVHTSLRHALISDCESAGAAARLHEAIVGVLARGGADAARVAHHQSAVAARPADVGVPDRGFP